MNDLKEALSVFNWLVHKETPKKPDFVVYDDCEWLGSWRCPSCNGTVEVNQNYCPHCGQHLDWSGVIE